MTTYTNRFSGDVVGTAASSFNRFVFDQTTFNPVSGVGIIQTEWPINGTDTGYVISDSNEVVSLLQNNTRLILAPSDQVSVGQEFLVFYSPQFSGYTLSVVTSTGDPIQDISPTVNSISAYLFICVENTVSGGIDSGSNWKALPFAAPTSSAASAAALAGDGLSATTDGTNRIQTSFDTVQLTGSFTVPLSHRSSLLLATATAGSLTITLPSPGAAGNGWNCSVRNGGTGTMTVTSPASNVDNSQSGVSYSPGQSALVICDGTNYYTVGGFDTSNLNIQYSTQGIDVSTQSGSALSPLIIPASVTATILTFTGTQPQAMSYVAFQPTRQVYFLRNTSTKPIVVGIRNVAGTGYLGTQTQVANGATAVVVSDGTNMYAGINQLAGGANLNAQDGTAATPSIFFGNATGTGLYNAIPGLGMSVNGSSVAVWGASSVNFASGYDLNTNGGDITAGAGNVSGAIGTFTGGINGGKI